MSIENEEINRVGIIEKFENQSTTTKLVEGAAALIATAAAAYLTHGKGLSLVPKLGAKYEIAGEAAGISKSAFLNPNAEVNLLSSSRALHFGGEPLKFGPPKSTLDFTPSSVLTPSGEHLSHIVSPTTGLGMVTKLSRDLEQPGLPFKSAGTVETHTIDFAPPQRISLNGAEATNSNLRTVENLDRQVATPPREIAAVEPSLGAKPAGFIKLGALGLTGVGALALAGCDDKPKDCDRDKDNCNTSHGGGGGYVARPGYSGTTPYVSGGYGGYSGRGTTEAEPASRGGSVATEGEAVGGARGGFSAGEGGHGGFGGAAGGEGG